MLFRMQSNMLFRLFPLLTAQAGFAPVDICLISENCYRWVVLYAPTLSREGATPTILRGSRKRYVMQKHKKSLFMQDSPGNSSVPRTSHRFKFKRKWRKTVFRLAFKALEVLLVVLQIIQCFCEMFKK